MIKLPLELRSSMAAELVNDATSEKLKEVDWSKNIEICELVSRDHSKGKEVIKSVKKRLKNKNPNVQLFAAMILEMLLNNCGEHIHKHVIENGILPILVKIVKKKNDLPVRERIFLLLDATQTATGGASGKFPQYYASYYDLVSAGVQFPQRSNPASSTLPTSNAHSNNLHIQGNVSTRSNGVIQQPAAQVIPDSSILQKATSVLEVLREVLDALEAQHPEGASDEFTLDLVEQCSFQQQRVMHLIMTYRDENVVSQAINLNEQLLKILAKHDALLSAQPTSGATFINHKEEDEEEEDLDSLLHRIRKGKACAEDDSNVPPGLFRPSQREKPRWAAARPLCIEPQETIGLEVSPGPLRSNQREKPQWATAKPLCIEPDRSNNSNGDPHVIGPFQLRSVLNSSSNHPGHLPVSIPPPPAKHMERERFFKEKQVNGASGLPGHARHLSLHSRDGSSSQSGSGSGSTDFSDRDPFALRD